MAMKTASPWWVSLTLGVGVLLFAVSERMFGHIEGIRYFVSGVGGVVKRALTTHSRPAATVPVVETSRPGSVISPSTVPVAN